MVDANMGLYGTQTWLQTTCLYIKVSIIVGKNLFNKGISESTTRTLSIYLKNSQMSNFKPTSQKVFLGK